MLISKEVKVLLNNRIKYYEEKGYNIPKYIDKNGTIRIKRGSFLMVKVEDLPEHSPISVKVECDYCHKEYNTSYNSFIVGRKSIVAKDCCNVCKPKKQEETCLLKYGVKSNLAFDEIKQYNLNRTRFTYYELYSIFQERNCILLSKEEDYKNQNSELCFTCKNHPDIIQYTTMKKYIQTTFCCKLCSKEINSKVLVTRTIDDVRKIFEERNYQLLSTSFKNVATKLDFICLKHKKLGTQHVSLNGLLSNNHACKDCFRESISKENSSFWKGGVSEITDYLRKYITPWKNDSMKNCKYRCVITNIKSDKDFEIHHVYGFNMIIQELFNIVNIPIKTSINEYTLYELDILKNKVLELHYQYGLGMVLHSKIHRLFHKIYNCGNNSIQQFEEFKERYFSGEFDNELEERLKSYNSIKRIKLKEVS